MLQKLAAPDGAEQRDSGDAHRTRIDALTGLRAVAALSVLFAHALDTSFIYGGHLIDPLHNFAVRLADFGMSLFFVLSGFVIQINYGASFRRRQFGEASWRFFVARFSRLYPLYALSIILVLYHIPSPFVEWSWVSVCYLTLTQSWFNVQQMIFPPDWSISTEWFFYLSFLPLTFVVSRIRRPIVALALFVLVSPIALIVLFSFKTALTDGAQLVMWHGDRVSYPIWGWIIYLSPYVRVLEFVAGVLAAKVYEKHWHGKGGDRGADAFAWGCVAWFLIVVIMANVTKGVLANIASNFVFAPAIALLLALVACHKTTMGRLLSSSSLVYFGEISFSIYIWCWFAMTLLSPDFVSPQASVLAYINSTVKVVAIIGTTIIFAAGSYRLVEMPAQRWLRRKLIRA